MILPATFPLKRHTFFSYSLCRAENICYQSHTLYAAGRLANVSIVLPVQNTDEPSPSHRSPKAQWQLAQGAGAGSAFNLRVQDSGRWRKGALDALVDAPALRVAHKVHQRGRLEVLARQALDPRRHGRREQHGLPRCGHTLRPIPGFVSQLPPFAAEQNTPGNKETHQNASCGIYQGPANTAYHP